MKTSTKDAFCLFLLGAVLGSASVGKLTAQSFASLHSFGTDPCSPPFLCPQTEGRAPYGELLLLGNALYGTTIAGGSSDQGTVFAIATNGSDFTSLYFFSGGSNGSYPKAGFALLGNRMYGTTVAGGSSFAGSVFASNTDGSDFMTLHSFTATGPPTYYNSDGASPEAPLVASSNTLYGTGSLGGNSGAGTVFAVNVDGTGFRTLHSFSNSDGANPHGDLLLSSNMLYGTTAFGANGFNPFSYSGSGTVFALKTDGTSFATLHYFAATNEEFSTGFHTNSDGASPLGGLTLSGNTLYGTAAYGGSSGKGTVFKVSTDGTGFMTLHNFTETDGANPQAPLILCSNTLYGTAAYGGSSGKGTVFKVSTDGTGFMTLHNFTATYRDISMGNTNADGANPFGGVTLSGNTLYGTANDGGKFGRGTVFSISLPLNPPPLTIIPSGSDIILTWPTNAISYTLQSTTNLFAPVWNTNLPLSDVVNGQNTVTNPMSSTEQFYRLKGC